MQDRSRRTVEDILDAAAHVFGQRGYTATTTNHVAEEAGVSIGSLYQYFSDKDALLVALEERHLARVEEELADLVRRWRATEPEVVGWARSLVDALVAANDTPLHLVMYDTAPPLPHLRAAAEAVVETLVSETIACLRRWGHGVDPDLRARLVVVATVRLVHDVVIRVGPGPDRTRARDELIRMLVAAATAGPVPLRIDPGAS